MFRTGCMRHYGCDYAPLLRPRMRAAVNDGELRGGELGVALGGEEALVAW